ncbi:MAG: MFS transporter [Proteobacteria bacterium]|nr:MFS transporter [Pseudomonadota bacterium]
MSPPASPPIPRTRWLLVLLLCGGGVLAGGQFAKVAAGLAQLQAAYGVSSARLGLLLSTVGVMGLVFGVVAGSLAPRLGYRRLLVLGLAGGALLSGVQALLPPYALFWASRVPEGLSHLAIMVATPTLLIHITAPAQRTAVMGLWATVVGLAFALAAGLDRLVPGGLSAGQLLAGHALLMAAAALAVRVGVPNLPPAPATPRPPGGPLALHRAVYADLRTALPGLAFFFYAFPTIALITFVPRLVGAGQAGFVTLLPLMATGGTLAAGWAARRLGAGLRGVRWAYAAFALSALALALAARWGGPTEGLALLTLACAGLCGGAASTLIPQLNPTPDGQARASGALVQLGNLGSVCGPPLFGLVAELAGPAGLGSLAGVAGLAVLTAAAALGMLAWVQRSGLPASREPSP